MNQLKQFTKDAFGVEHYTPTEGSNSRNATTEASSRAKLRSFFPLSNSHVSQLHFLSLDASQTRPDALRNPLLTPLRGIQFENTKRTNNNQSIGYRTLDDFINEDGNSDETIRSTKNETVPRVLEFDLARIVHELKNPKDLSGALQDYMPRNKDFKMEDLLTSNNTKIQRFKDCVYFGHVTNGNRHGKGISMAQ